MSSKKLTKSKLNNFPTNLSMNYSREVNLKCDTSNPMSTKT